MGDDARHIYAVLEATNARHIYGKMSQQGEPNPEISFETYLGYVKELQDSAIDFVDFTVPPMQIVASEGYNPLTFHTPILPPNNDTGRKPFDCVYLTPSGKPLKCRYQGFSTYFVGFERPAGEWRLSRWYRFSNEDLFYLFEGIGEGEITTLPYESRYDLLCPAELESLVFSVEKLGEAMDYMADLDEIFPQQLQDDSHLKMCLVTFLLMLPEAARSSNLLLEFRDKAKFDWWMLSTARNYKTMVRDYLVLAMLSENEDQYRECVNLLAMYPFVWGLGFWEQLLKEKEVKKILLEIEQQAERGDEEKKKLLEEKLKKLLEEDEKKKEMERKRGSQEDANWYTVCKEFNGASPITTEMREENVLAILKSITLLKDTTRDSIKQIGRMKLHMPPGTKQRWEDASDGYDSRQGPKRRKEKSSSSQGKQGTRGHRQNMLGEVTALQFDEDGAMAVGSSFGKEMEWGPQTTMHGTYKFLAKKQPETLNFTLHKKEFLGDDFKSQGSHVHYNVTDISTQELAKLVVKQAKEGKEKKLSEGNVKDLSSDVQEHKCMVEGPLNNLYQGMVQCQKAQKMYNGRRLFYAGGPRVAPNDNIGSVASSGRNVNRSVRGRAANGAGCGNTGSPIGTHLPRQQGTKQSVGNIGSTSNFPSLCNPNSQPSVGGPLSELEYVNNAFRSVYAVDYVTQGAQGGFRGNFLNWNTQAGYSGFGSVNGFESQDYMTHGSQEQFTQVRFSDPSMRHSATLA
ncbi:hypothetical protein Tsubulata_017319 [Turnera subulata]|uniref:Uncharacterized protein n=1 Tax=Turnera subulata TaxID=218843 RepID=A0A9Q0FUY9_9ROSI|nr:hypothetical protein Tsubulata_017319 [Turnera subulata]